MAVEDCAAFEITGVETLDIGDAPVVLQARMHLVVSDIDADHMACAAFEQDVGEAAGGGPDIEADAALGRKTEMIEPSGKLQRRARDVILGGVRDRDPGVFRHGRRGLGDHFAVDGHGAAFDRIARPRAAGDEVAGEDELVEALVSACHGHPMAPKVLGGKPFVS